MSSFTKEQAEELQRRVVDMGTRFNIEKQGERFAIVAKANLAPRKSMQNKSEQAYDQWLDALYKQGRIAYYKFEAVTLKLGDDCRFSPDFLVIGPAGEVEFHDVKAKWKSTGKVRIEDDARVKLAVAASTCFSFFTFCTVWLENGTWHKKTY